MTDIPDSWRKPPFIASPVLRYGLAALVIAYLVWSVSSLPFDWARISDGLTRAGRIFSGAFPPSFARSGLLIDGFLESLKIALIATAGGVLLSVPVALMAARNLAPLPIYLIGRAIIIVARSFHPVIVAIIFVKAVGFGPLAGMLTLVVYSIGFVAKMLAERIEEIDHGQVEAVSATGAGRLQTLLYAIVPQVKPLVLGVSIYRWDINIRESTVLGLVGAGGIGFTLNEAILGLEWARVGLILLVVLAVVLVSEAVSAIARARLI